MNYAYFTATLDAAVWGAELARGEGRGRIYIVEPTGAFEDDANVTNKRFPGNPTQSFRSRAPLRIVGELTGWVGHWTEKLQEMREGIGALRSRGPAQIEDCPAPRSRSRGPAHIEDSPAPWSRSRGPAHIED